MTILQLLSLFVLIILLIIAIVGLRKRCNDNGAGISYLPQELETRKRIVKRPLK